MTFNPTSNRYERITRALLDEPWCIIPSKLEAIADFVYLKAQGGTLSESEILAIRASVPPIEGQRAGAIAILPVFGTLRNRANIITEASGGTSVELLSKQFALLMSDPNIAAIVLDIDSPGGSVAGIPEFAAQIHAARQIKPIVAVANTLAASAAYWLGSAATEFVAAPSAEVGSVGAVMVHEDRSAMAEREGVKVTLISAGRYKTEGNPFEPLGDDALSSLQARVDDAYATFTADVARFRGASIGDVRGAAYGEGRVLTARKAQGAGMVDRVETLDAVLSRLMRPQGIAALRRDRGARVLQEQQPTVEQSPAPRSEYEPDALAAVIERLDRIESRLPTPISESETEPATAGLEIDPEALATAVAAILKGAR